MSWGHIISKDLLEWTQASSLPALVPDQVYDIDGVFTGCWIPPVDELDTTLRVAYSSVKKLPFHWSMPSYPRNAAGLSIAMSCDGGLVWTKSSRNPILVGEPPDLDVTGFRDPYVTELPLAAGDTGATVLYGLISGGIRDSGPTTFLYEIQRKNLEDWRYLGPLISLPLRFQPSKKWSGNYGVNWECTNLVALRTGSESRDFLIIGAEGDVEKDHVSSHQKSSRVPSRTVRAQLWLSGHLGKGDDGVQFRPHHGGYLDHGPYYAANSFLDPRSGSRIVHGWIPEEDLPLAAAAKKGWNGSLALPREIFLLRIPKVTGTLQSPLQDIYPFELKAEPDGSTTVLTLGVRPIRELAQLRDASEQILQRPGPVALPASGSIGHWTIGKTQSIAWELEATIAVHPGCQEVGFHLRHNGDLSIRTTVTFCTITETITVDRRASNHDPTVNTCPDAGPFTLLTTGNVIKDCEPTREKLHLRIFSDGDILEVFANDRFALATMVYSDTRDLDSHGVTAFAAGNVKSAVFETVTVWDGLKTASLSRGHDSEG